MRKDHTEYVRRILGLELDGEIPEEAVALVEQCEKLTRRNRGHREMSWECLEVLLTPLALSWQEKEEKQEDGNESSFSDLNKVGLIEECQKRDINIKGKSSAQMRELIEANEGELASVKG